MDFDASKRSQMTEWGLEAILKHITDQLLMSLQMTFDDLFGARDQRAALANPRRPAL